jgi:hypothetical protein
MSEPDQRPVEGRHKTRSPSSGRVITSERRSLGVLPAKATVVADRRNGEKLPPVVAEVEASGNDGIYFSKEPPTEP